MNTFWNFIITLVGKMDLYGIPSEQKKTPLNILPIGILLITGVIMIFRTADFFFEADDLKFLWWAATHPLEPWRAFTDPSLFGFYYRPVISLVWWLHSLCFGIDAHYHQMALGIWWLLIIGLVYYWTSKEAGILAGFAAGLFLLASLPMQNLIVWKSWLTTCCSVVFHFITLISLQRYLVQSSKKMLWLFIVFFVLASLSKESARFILLFTCGSLILVHPGKNRIDRKFILSLVCTLWFFFLISSHTLRDYLSLNSRSFMHFQDALPNFCFFASTLFSNHWIAFITYLAVTYYFCMDKPVFFWRPVLCHLCSLGAYGWAVILKVPQEQAIAFALLIYMHGLWLAPNLKFTAMPLTWLFFSFWSLNSLPLLFIAYGADAAIAMALLVGYVFAVAFKNAAPLLRSNLRLIRITVVAALLLVVVCSLRQSIQSLNNRVTYMEYTYHIPIKLLLSKIRADLTGIRSWGDIYVDVGDQLGLETYLAQYFAQKQFAFHVIPTRPPAASWNRLEAYTGNNYHVDPCENPLNVWLPPGLNPLVESRALNDPYFMPELWDINRIGPCNDLEGWDSKAKSSREIYPLGQDGSYVNFVLTWSKEPIVCTFTSKQECTWLEENASFTLSFWLQSQRWNMIDHFTVILKENNKQYVWENVAPAIVNTWNQWKRVCLQRADAQITVSNETAKTFQLQILTHIKNFNDEVGTYLSVDEIRLAKKKPQVR